MDTNKKARIAHVKARLKDLVTAQKQDKQKCRQPHTIVYDDKGRYIGNSAPQWQVLCRSYEISGLLNAYHQIRGKNHRHTPTDKWKAKEVRTAEEKFLRDIFEKYPVLETEAESAA